MFPRYERKNKKYKLKPPKEKMTFERKTIRRSALVCVLVLTGIFMSFFNLPFEDKISKVLYITCDIKSVSGWFKPAMRIIKNGGHKIYLAYIDEEIRLKENLGIKEGDNAAAKASPVNPKDKALLTVPLKGDITSPYGMREHPIDGVLSMHSGVDICAPYGESVYSAGYGRVIEADSDSYNGNFVRIRHTEDIVTFYAHLSDVNVKAGDEVTPSVKIGEVGSTGISTGPHLHFEVIEKGKAIDPCKKLPKDDTVEIKN